jgi:MerR family transcriptional regulator, light-induced transcriptional regulator
MEAMMNDFRSFHPPSISTDLVETFTSLVFSGDGGDAGQLVDRLMAEGAPREAIMMDLLAPSARKMGELWCEDRRDFVEVTLGLSRIQQLLRRSQSPGDMPQTVKGNALLAAVPGEQHTFGLRLVEEHLLRAGWKVTICLRPTEPEIVAYVAGEIYDFVGFSLTSECLLPALHSAIDNVRTASRNRGVRIIVGGVLFDGRSAAASEIDADAIANDAQEAVARVSNWCALAEV